METRSTLGTGMWRTNYIWYRHNQIRYIYDIYQHKLIMIWPPVKWNWILLINQLIISRKNAIGQCLLKIFHQIQYTFMNFNLNYESQFNLSQSISLLLNIIHYTFIMIILISWNINCILLWFIFFLMELFLIQIKFIH